MIRVPPILALISILVLFPSSGLLAEENQQSNVKTTTIKEGDLSVTFRDNSGSPRILSGIGELLNLKQAPNYNAFADHAGLNFEHIISGHPNRNNKFTPRHGRYDLFPLPEKNSVVLVRQQEDSPWKVSSRFQYTVQKPHYIDFDFECQLHDPSLFGARGYAIFFFASYVHDVAEVPIRFRGVDSPQGEEKWISAEAPPGHPHWNKGGTYRHVDAKPLEYDQDVEFNLNSWSYDYPRFTKPFYYGLSKNGMVLIQMFDQTSSPEAQIRFSLFKFMVPDEPAEAPKHPARDFQYVINDVNKKGEYGFRGRMVWKKFISPEDCLKEYESWKKEIHQ